jgi:hypothetical protein
MGWLQATGSTYDTLRQLFLSKSLKLVSANPEPGSSAWEALPLLDTVQEGPSVVLGLVLTEGAHFEGDRKILYKLSCLLDVFPESATSLSNCKQSLLDGSRFRAASLYHSIKPTGREQIFTGDVEGLRCELRPFQVRILSDIVAGEWWIFCQCIIMDTPYPICVRSPSCIRCCRIRCCKLLKTLLQRRSLYWMLKQEGYVGLPSQSTAEAGAQQQKRKRNRSWKSLAAMDASTNSEAVLFMDVRDGTVQLDDPPEEESIRGGVYRAMILLRTQC